MVLERIVCLYDHRAHSVSAVVDKVYVPQQRRLGEYQDKYVASWMTKFAQLSSFRQQNLYILIRHQPL